MLTSFYLFITPLLVVFFYLSYKFFVNRKEIQKIEENAFLNLKEKVNNLEEAKEKVFIFTDKVKAFVSKTLVVFFHWVLHFFVIFLGFISDLADFLYSEARNFFLKSATKEKSAVATFWNHLKEYKKEKEEEKKDK